MSISEKELQDAYKKNQQMHGANDSLKHSVMRHHRMIKSQQRSAFSLFVTQLVKWFNSSSVRFVAVAFAMVALFGVYGVGKWQLQNFAGSNASNNADITTVSIVNYHGYDSEAERFKTNNSNTERNNANKRRTKFNTYTDSYYASQAIAQAVVVQDAMLYADNGSWTLLNCAREQVVVSEGLLATLNMSNRIEGDIAVGSSVYLSLNADGRILSIKSSAQPLQCKRLG